MARSNTKLLKDSMGWYRCCKCNKKTKSPRMKDNKIHCYQCFIKGKKLMGGRYNKSRISFEDALSRTYEVKRYLLKTKNGNYSIHTSCNFPSILVGHKFKIVPIKRGK